MKRLPKLLTFILFISLLIACDKDDDSSESEMPAGAELGIITVTVNGTEFSTNTSTTTVTSGVQGGVTVLQFSGSEITSGNVINVIVADFTGEGTYRMSGTAFIDAPAVGLYSEVDVATQQLQQWLAPFDESDVGLVTFTSVSETNVQGTFSFRAQNLDDGSFRQITNGTFNLDY